MATKAQTLTQTSVLKKETKGTAVYDELVEGESPVRTVYVTKRDARALVNSSLEELLIFKKETKGTVVYCERPEEEGETPVSQLYVQKRDARTLGGGEFAETIALTLEGGDAAASGFAATLTLTLTGGA